MFLMNSEGKLSLEQREIYCRACNETHALKKKNAELPSGFSFFSFFKVLNLLQYCFCFMFCFFGQKACGILAPQPTNPVVFTT